MLMRAPAKPVRLALSDPRGRGEPVLLVHGFGHNRSVWDALAAGLPAAWRPLAVDLRGHGESDWSPDRHYGVGDYAVDLEAVLDALELARVVIVGHSLGGHAAVRLASEAPDRVAALVLVDTGPSLASGGVLHVAEDVADTLRSYESVAAFRERLGLTHPQADGARLDRLAETGLVRRRDGRFEPKTDPGILEAPAEGADLSTVEREMWQALGRVACRTLVVRGGLSAMLSDAVARRMVEDVLADARLETLGRAGHGVMLDDGPGLLGLVSDFLSEIPGSVSRAAPTSPRRA